MILEITNQEQYSRGELLLRVLFGWIYIELPHLFLLFFLSIWSSILTFISFWAILFTGRYPQSFYEFNEKYYRWTIRVNARMWNLCDDYPRFGLDADDKYVRFELPYPEDLSRGLAVLKVVFGWLYVGIPHGFALFFRAIASFVVAFIAFWVVLFTGKYPNDMHEFNVGTIRWSTRVSLYLSLMIDDYPPFSGKRMENEYIETEVNDSSYPEDNN